MADKLQINCTTGIAEYVPQTKKEMAQVNSPILEEPDIIDIPALLRQVRQLEERVKKLEEYLKVPSIPILDQDGETDDLEERTPVYSSLK